MVHYQLLRGICEYLCIKEELPLLNYLSYYKFKVVLTPSVVCDTFTEHTLLN